LTHGVTLIGRAVWHIRFLLTVHGINCVIYSDTVASRCLTSAVDIFSYNKETTAFTKLIKFVNAYAENFINFLIASKSSYAKQSIAGGFGDNLK